jgi:hypothetical protein
MKTFNKKSAIILTLLFIGTILISSCKREDPEPIVYGNANIRIVNAVVGSVDQDFYQGDTKLSTSAIPYGGYSSYLTVKAGPSTISYRNTGLTTISASTNIGIDDNASYTAFIYSNVTGAKQITGFQDDPALPAAGKARVRFVNLGAAFNNTINVSYATPGGAPLATGLLYLYASGYSSIDPGLDLSVTVLNAPTSAVIPGSNFVAGKIYTVWFDAATSTSANYHVIIQN